MKTQTSTIPNQYGISAEAMLPATGRRACRSGQGLALLLLTLLLAGPGRAAQITWTNTAGGNWSGPANWSPNQVPAAADTAVITNDGNYTVTMDVSPAIAGLVVGATAGVNTQTLVANGQMLSLNGQVTVNARGLFNMNGTLAGAVAISGPVNWSGGTLVSGASLTVAANGVLNLTGNQSIYGPLTNNGTVNWQSGNLYVYYYAGYGYYGGIWNQAGAQWNLQCDQTLSDPSYSLPTFNNAGTLTKSGTGGTTTISALFNNLGPVQALSGMLLFNQGANIAGNFQTTTGTAINFAGNLTLAGPTTISNLVDNGATVSGLNYLVGNASLTNCTIPDAVTVANTFNWSGGTLAGSLTVAAGGVLNLTGTQSIYGPLTNNGTVNWQSGNLNVFYYAGYGYYGGIWNQAGAHWNLQCDQTLNDPSYSLPTFHNAGTLTKSGTSGTTTISALFNNLGPVQALSGTLLFNQGANIAGNFQTTTGTAINFAGNLTLTGPTTMASLALSGATLTGLSNLVGNTNLSLTNCTIPDAVTVANTFNWSGGTLTGSLTVAAGGVLNLTGTQSIYGPLTNNGTVNWQSGNLNVFYYAGYGYYGGIWNQAGAQWNLQCDQTLSDPSYSLPTFNNAGTLTKSGTGGTTTISALFNNLGPVQALSGTLLFNQGANISGNFQTTTGTAINFAGNLTLTGPTTMASLALSGATLTGLSNLAGNSSLSLTNCTIPDAVTIASTFNWSGGTLTGSLTVAPGAVLNLTGTPAIEGPLTNNGTVNWQGGNLNVYYYSGSYYGEIWNQAGAHWNLQCDQTLNDPSYSLPTFHNAGTLTKSGSSGTTYITALFNNSGTLDVQTGTVTLYTGQGSGLFLPAAGATLVFPQTYEVDSALTGAGTNLLNSGTFTLNGNINGSNVVLNGANLLASNTVINSALTWNGGSVLAGSVVTVATNRLLLLNGGYGHFFYGILTNAGTILLPNGGGGLALDGSCQAAGAIGELVNLPGGLVDIQGDNSISFACDTSELVINQGVLRKSGGTGTTAITPPFINSGTVQAGSGTVSFSRAYIQSAGQTLLTGGNLVFAQPAQFLGGNLTGTGAITGSLSNNATLGTGTTPGLLSLSGNYSEGPSAHLTIKLGGTLPGTNYDQLSIGGSAALAGTLDLSYDNDFTPTVGNIFTVLAGNTRTGTFSTITTGPGHPLAVSYDAKTVLVEPGNVPPVPKLTLPAQVLAGHPFQIQGSGTDADGSVTNMTLLFGTNLLVSAAGSSAVASFSCDFPGSLAFTAVATDNNGAQSTTNGTMTITNLPAMTLDGIAYQTNRAFKLCMVGVPGTNYQVWVSTNLATASWTSLGTMENTNGIWRFLDLAATNSSYRFYRAKQLP